MMKKLLIGIMAITMSSFANATLVRIGDIVLSCISCNKTLIKNSLTTNSVIEINTIPKHVVGWLNVKLIKAKYDNAQTLSEFDNLLCNNVINIDHLEISKADFPKTFAAILKYREKNYPVTTAKCEKYGVVLYKDAATICDIDDMIDIINANEFDLSKYTQFNNRLKNAAIKVVKIAIRKSGKSFVATKDKDGKVVFNPMKQPMQELTDIMNGPKYDGLKEWCQKYGANWKEITLPWMKSDAEMKKLMDDILIDETRIQDHEVELRLYLGVDKFNAFVKEYNEGVTK